MSKYLATSALTAVSLLIGAGGASIYAQATAPIYAVAEINVKDKDSYDKILPKALEIIKNGGGKNTWPAATTKPRQLSAHPRLIAMFSSDTMVAQKPSIKCGTAVSKIG